MVVLDINKLAEEKKGDGVTVPTSVFNDGRNLVFVDEGHKGQKSEASVWKACRPIWRESMRPRQGIGGS